MEDSRNAVIIGGTDGVGKEIAYGLAQTGCNVLIVGRDAAKAGEVKFDIQQKNGNPNIQCLTADLALMFEASDLVCKIKANFNRVHYLVQSAGIILNKRVITSEGIETNFAVNYLSRFVITNGLLPLMEKAGKPESLTIL
jgi:short-subunit dehydrogenase